MLRCPELSRLPKAPRFRSILWRHQSPGSVAALLAPGTGSNFLDPSHPAARWKTRSFPQYRGKDIQIKMFPVSLLGHPPNVIYPFRRPFLSFGDRVKRVQEAGITAVEIKGDVNLFWKKSGKPVGLEQLYFEDEQEMIQRVRLPECRAMPKGPLLQVAAEKARQRVPMSYFTATSKARMGAKRHVRRTITLRVKAALNLIVTRGAFYDGVPKNSGHVEGNCVESPPTATALKFDENEAISMGRKWILQGWSYVFAPTVEVYRMPYSTLIPVLRNALTTLNTQAIEMENKWLADSLLHQQRIALKGDFPQQIVNNRDMVPQNSVPKSSKPKPLHNEATTRNKSQSCFDAVVWKNNLEAEIQLLAQLPKVKPRRVR